MRKISHTLLTLLMLTVIGWGDMPAPAQPSLLPTQEATLEQLRLSFSRKRPPRRGGSRGGPVCSIAPGILEKEFVIWSDRPSFFWRTADTANVSLQKLELFQETDQQPTAEKPLPAEILWDKTLTKSDQTADYAGRPLQPGQTYRWNLTWNQPGSSSPQKAIATSLSRQFRVMAAPQRNQIAVDLQTIATQLRTRKASDEAIAIQQATYFANQGLLSDALQVLAQIKNPSPEATKTLQALLQESAIVLCPPDPQSLEKTIPPSLRSSR